ncbi:MAG: metallophosphatase family protein [Anaerolineae bacterium]|nr:metallophosphatase family protein [Anaerolineae bacterium]
MSDASHPSTIELPECRYIGVLADTHIPHRLSAMPPQVYDLLGGSDLILHAGDLETPDILPPLQAIAPTYAVRGNLHWQFSTGMHDQDLPLCVTLRVGRHVIWMTHGHISLARSLMDKVTGIGMQHSLAAINQKLIARLARLKPPEADIVIFGHSHLSCAVRLNGTLYFNPGAISASAVERSREGPRIGRLMLRDDGGVEYEWREI